MFGLRASQETQGDTTMATLVDRSITKTTADDAVDVPEDDPPVQPLKAGSATVDIHCLPTNDGIIVKVTPPTDWDSDGNPPAAAADASADANAAPPHVPCDIVLVIDVSGSMGMDAPVPAAEGAPVEDTGLSVLDLVKHAARTILETLNACDRLAIVTFASKTTVLQALLPMTPANKAHTETNIAGMQPDDSTNLWQAILTGLKLLDGKTRSGRVPSLMVLTDGVPNFMSPAQGFIPKMRTLPPIPAPIHTFGFGYSLRSGLLKSISEFTGGNYAFIPDAGMIGTVFVHAVANMQSTFATDAVVHLTMPDDITLTETLGQAVQKPRSRPLSPKPGQNVLTVNVGTLQYGQSRDIYLKYHISPNARSGLPVHAKLEYKRMADAVLGAEASCQLVHGSTSMDVDAAWDMLDDTPDKAPGNTPMPGAAPKAAFHVSRSMLCRFIAKFFPLDKYGDHVARSYHPDYPNYVASFIQALPAGQPQHKDDPMCQALMADITGQVTLALSNPDHYRRWGKHYLPSLQGAHAVQQCNSFKDPGPLLYAADSPRFIACRNALDTAFDTLPPPRPSNARYHHQQLHHHHHHHQTPLFGMAQPGGGGGTSTNSGQFSMATYRSAIGPCFASFCRVSMASGATVRVGRLRKGMLVQTPRGPRAVSQVLKTPVSSMSMVTIGRLLITAWHPVSHNGADWMFPCRDKARKDTPVRYTGSIYSVLLEQDADADAHALKIEGLWVVTLGHGLTDKADAANPDDVRIHGFLGDYEAVCRSLATLDVRKNGLVINGGSARSKYRLWHTKK